jgi:hypothetical protein
MCSGRVGSIFSTSGTRRVKQMCVQLFFLQFNMNYISYIHVDYASFY